MVYAFRRFFKVLLRNQTKPKKKKIKEKKKEWVSQARNYGENWVWTIIGFWVQVSNFGPWPSLDAEGMI